MGSEYEDLLVEVALWADPKVKRGECGLSLRILEPGDICFDKVIELQLNKSVGRRQGCKGGVLHCRYA